MKSRNKGITFLICACAVIPLMQVFPFSMMPALLAEYMAYAYFLIPLFALISLFYAIRSIKDDKMMILVTVADVAILGILIIGLFIAMNV